MKEKVRNEVPQKSGFGCMFFNIFSYFGQIVGKWNIVGYLGFNR